MGEAFVLEDVNGHGPVTATGPIPAARSLIGQVSSEIDEYLMLAQTFSREEPDEVLRHVSAVTARLSYLRVALIREGGARANKLRTQELDPLMENLDLQFKIASRLLTSRQFDFEVTRGAPS